MADNSVRTPGVGETIASDDIGGVKYQRVKLNIGADGSAVDVLVPADAMTAASAGIVPIAPELFNETTFDRQRGNTQGTLLASAARTSTAISATQTNYNSRGVMLVLNVTAASGTGGLTTVIRLLDPVTGTAVVDDLFGTNVLATGTYGYQYYPGVSPAADNAGSTHVVKHVSGVLPRTWLAYVQHGDASSYTYSLGYALII